MSEIAVRPVLALSPHSLESYIMFLGLLILFGSMLALPFFFNRGERTLNGVPGPLRGS